MQHYALQIDVNLSAPASAVSAGTLRSCCATKGAAGRQTVQAVPASDHLRQIPWPRCCLQGESTVTRPLSAMKLAIELPFDDRPGVKSWCDWYAQDKLSGGVRETNFKHVELPPAEAIQEVADFGGGFDISVTSVTRSECPPGWLDESQELSSTKVWLGLNIIYGKVSLTTAGKRRTRICRRIGFTAGTQDRTHLFVR